MLLTQVSNKIPSKKHGQIQDTYFHHILTLAFGFKLDLSELRDPIEELGDKPGAIAAEFTAPRSDVDDVELSGLWEEFPYSDAEGSLLGTAESGNLSP